MKKARRPKGVGDFRAHVQRLLPEVLERFLAHAPAVVGHPSRVAALHAMRLDGKPLRYLLEFSAPMFGGALDGDLEEVKRLVTILGRIHDCDVHLPRIRRQTAVVRQYNRLVPSRTQRIAVGALQTFLRTERTLRKTLFHEACGILLRWKSEQFEDGLRRHLRYPAFE
jgi:CHAD domain-containing protein